MYKVRHTSLGNNEMYVIFFINQKQVINCVAFFQYYENVIKF